LAPQVIVFVTHRYRSSTLAAIHSSGNSELDTIAVARTVTPGNERGDSTGDRAEERDDRRQIEAQSAIRKKVQLEEEENTEEEKDKVEDQYTFLHRPDKKHFCPASFQVGHLTPEMSFIGTMEKEMKIKRRRKIKVKIRR
jgi:hypothetical protein